MSTVIQGPRCNRRVTNSTNPLNDRSESAIIINPRNPYHMVGASKKFSNPATYEFSIACYYSFDGGLSWDESPPLGLLPGWAGVSDPALAFDNLGNVFLLGLAFANPLIIDLRGIAAYISSDGGRTWSAPNHIHNVNGDDKQWIVGDVTYTSPFYGNIYGCWDSGSLGTSAMCFAKTTDHGLSWHSVKIGGVSQPSGTAIPGINDSGAPEINVARDGSIYIVWWSGGSIRFTKSADGGDTFTPPQNVATGITSIPSQFPGTAFRVETLPTACCGAASHVVVAWADYREGVSRVYYRKTADGGATWLGPGSGSPLLTGAVASAANQHDFHPQLASTPAGEIGCAFYEYGPKSDFELAPSLIDVVLAVSTNNGATFVDRAVVTNRPWDPTVNAPRAHGSTTITFIGDYFGIDASVFGFYPFWTDTRTGTQEMFVSRISVNPADVFVRDSSTDVGNLPSPGDHWEYVDLVVRHQADGDMNFINEDLLHDGVTDHYIYARVKNNGPNKARNVILKATMGNWPALDGLPGSEFRYPRDWYPGDWSTPAQAAVHINIGYSLPQDVNNGATKIIGPVVWVASLIPGPGTFHHPCLLAEIIADNNDADGGPDSMPLPGEGTRDDYNFSSFFWGSNNITQRNLSYLPVPFWESIFVNFSFIVGNLLSPSLFAELIIDKGKELAKVPMTLSIEPLEINIKPSPPKKPCCQGILEITQKTTLIIKCGDCVIGEIIAQPGTQWICKCGDTGEPEAEIVSFGSTGNGSTWQLNEPLSLIGFAKKAGRLFKATLSFATPVGLTEGSKPLVRIIQRNDKKVITGGVSLQLLVTGKNGKGSGSPKPKRTQKKVQTDK